MQFTCNICATENKVAEPEINRENSTCSKCGSNERGRDIAYLISRHFYTNAKPLSDCQPRKEIRGIGLSDLSSYKYELSRLFDYQNTYYHQQPQLDIMSVPENRFSTLDFLISSDVFEHVASPVQQAFDNGFKMLKKGGRFVLTVPFRLEGETEEHFPDLYQYEVTREGADYVLKNTTREGKKQEFRNLVFHGGPGETLELRVFAEKSIRKHLEKAGFKDIEFHRSKVLPFGIVHHDAWSVPVTAIKGA